MSDLGDDDGVHSDLRSDDADEVSAQIPDENENNDELDDEEIGETLTSGTKHVGTSLHH